MNDLVPRSLLPLLFLVPVAWVGGSVAVSRLSGWSRLARDFRGSPAGVVETVAFASAMMGSPLLPMRFQGILAVSAAREGLAMRFVLPLVPGCPPLLLPWDALGECRTWTLFGAMTRFRFAIGALEVTVTGRAARMLRRRFKELHPGGVLVMATDAQETATRRSPR